MVDETAHSPRFPVAGCFVPYIAVTRFRGVACAMAIRIWLPISHFSSEKQERVLGCWMGLPSGGATAADHHPRRRTWLLPGQVCAPHTQMTCRCLGMWS